MAQNYIRYCANRHPVKFSDDSPCPSRCPICFRSIPRNGPIFTEEVKLILDKEDDVKQIPIREIKIKAEPVQSKEEQKIPFSYELIYGGNCYHIPPEGTWIGREELAGDVLKGNLLVSRRHVFLKPDRLQGLQAKDMKSKNGTWYTRDGKKVEMSRKEDVYLQVDDILWIYDVPFTVKGE